jgi:hypothetical protein
VVSGEGGVVALGAWGSPFNPGSGVTYDLASATTTLQWWTPGAAPADVYRGALGAGTTRGSYAPPFWRLDTNGGSGSEAACLRNDVAGMPQAPPPGGPGGTRGTTGPLGQADDPNPPVDSGVYYLVATDAPGSGSTNAAGCANPAICTMKGWCELGTNFGAPCNANVDCPGGGACRVLTTFCKTSAGVAGNNGNGCGRYPACLAGTNALRLCQDDVDCPGSICVIPSATVTAAGSICLNVSGQMTPSPSGTVAPECPPAGSPARIVRQVTATGLCP